jgi:hypothetical protein
MDVRNTSDLLCWVLYDQHGSFGSSADYLVAGAWMGISSTCKTVYARRKVCLYGWAISSIVGIKTSRYLGSVLSTTLTPCL